LGFYAPCPKLAIASEITHGEMVDLQSYSLRPVRSSGEWAAYHAIRRDAIFAALLPNQSYDEHDPDEFAPGHFPHLLLRDGEVVGTVRIDLIGERAAGFRLIGIRPDVQRQGHGGTLLKLAEEAARVLGKTEIVINAHPTSLDFYLANGYREGEWADPGLVPSGLVRVGKRLP
jgi:GNAT superfamily N-acetyltransferase